MSQEVKRRFSATDASILSLIAETPSLSEDVFQRLLRLATDKWTQQVAEALYRRDWDRIAYAEDVRQFARDLYEHTNALHGRTPPVARARTVSA